MDLFSCLSPFVFCSFASGSRGNCYYVGKQDEGMLVDVGISAKQIMKVLTQNDIPLSHIKAILVTHDHIDHVLGLESLTKNSPIPIYAHPDCLQGIIEGKATKLVDARLLNEIEPMQPFEICGITVEAFPVLHDGRGAVGYHFNFEGHTLTIAYGTEETPMTMRCAAPFVEIDKATIRNLNVKGDIYTSEIHGGGLAGRMIGNCHVEYCNVGVTIHSA
jgi:phosphoribosyl 1,2-cyclic phosphodiesterase